LEIYLDIADMLHSRFINAQLYSLTMISLSEELNLAGVGSLGVEFIWGVLVNTYFEDSFPSSHW